MHAVLTGSDRADTAQNYLLKVEVVYDQKAFFGAGNISVSDHNVNSSWVHSGFSKKVNGVNLVRSRINELLAHTHTHTQSHTQCERGSRNLFLACLSAASIPHVTHIIMH